MSFLANRVGQLLLVVTKIITLNDLAVVENLKMLNKKAIDAGQKKKDQLGMVRSISFDGLLDKLGNPRSYSIYTTFTSLYKALG